MDCAENDNDEDDDDANEGLDEDFAPPQCIRDDLLQVEEAIEQQEIYDLLLDEGNSTTTRH